MKTKKRRIDGCFFAEKSFIFKDKPIMSKEIIQSLDVPQNEKSVFLVLSMTMMELYNALVDMVYSEDDTWKKICEISTDPDRKYEVVWNLWGNLYKNFAKRYYDGMNEKRGE